VNPLEAPGVELPLLDLFQALRRADLPLGIGEYRLLIQALQLGYGTQGEAQDEQRLRWLCKTLWAKNPREARLLDHHFDLMLARRAESLALQTAAEPTAPAENGAETNAAQPPAAPPAPGSAARPSQPEPAGRPAPAHIRQESEFELPPDDDMRFAHQLDQALQAPELGTTARQEFILGGEYYPVTPRQMKQSWRYLRRMVREGPKEVLNVPETVRKIGREGVLLEPVLEPRRINRMQLVLLLDQRGSMVPFGGLARQLIETAQLGGRLGQTGVFYFQNTPLRHLYRTPALTQGRPLDKVLAEWHSERTVVLIFSDAGAARGNLSTERVAQTQAFLKRLEKAVRRVVWLNPLPQARWAGTSAAAIARLVPMFEFSRRGLEAAIDVLRGRDQPVLGR
jgi:uncharacterized protein with von Willebrand factor type A (vWA) domain